MKAAAGGPREGVAMEEAADVIWVTNAPEFFVRWSMERRWDLDRFDGWLAAT
jgi:hypothetical protein